MDSAHVTTRGRIVIPARLRRKLGIKPGTKVCFIERGSDILFQPITKQYVRNRCGMLKSTTSVTAELLIERKKDREREQAKRKGSVRLRKLGVSPGSVLEWDEKNEEIIVRRVGQHTLADVHDALFPDHNPKRKASTSVKDGIRKHIRQKYARG